MYWPCELWREYSRELDALLMPSSTVKLLLVYRLRAESTFMSKSMCIWLLWLGKWGCNTYKKCIVLQYISFFVGPPSLHSIFYPSIVSTIARSISLLVCHFACPLTQSTWRTYCINYRKDWYATRNCLTNQVTNNMDALCHTIQSSQSDEVSPSYQLARFLFLTNQIWTIVRSWHC